VGAAGHALSAYVPRLVRRWLVETPASTHQILDATLVFVDISGFTRLSERLARQGRIGAEELTDAIGSCFSALLGVAYEGGATLLKFGGDALLLLFAGDDHAARACGSAVGMRRELVQAGRIDSSAGRIRLRMSIGIHSGAVHLFLVGSSHRELLVAGEAATETVTMEAAAAAGEIVISAATAAALPPSLVGGRRGSGRLLRGAPPTSRPAPVEPGTAWLDADALRCVPASLREHALAEDSEPEHRRVTIAFLGFGGLDHHLAADGPAVVARSLDGLVRHVRRPPTRTTSPSSAPTSPPTAARSSWRRGRPPRAGTTRSGCCSRSTGSWTDRSGCPCASASTPVTSSRGTSDRATGGPTPSWVTR
jgi:class 3 adenylate cyclase